LRALVAGWFSIDAGRATAGDILVRDVVCSWLDERDLAYDIAQERQFGSGVDWFRVAPTRYSHFVFVCGPVGKDLAVYELIERFSACRRIAVNVTVLDEAAEESFDLMLARDGVGDPRPDLALAAYVEHPPVMALVKMNDYPGARVDIAHGAFDRLLRARESSAFEVDTVLDQHVPGRRTAAEVQALLGRADLVLTTRLHGLVLALAQGVPAIAVDPMPGGAKVLRQAHALAWPAALAVDAIDDARLERLLVWCLSSEGRGQAEQCARTGATGVQQIRATFTARL
jgi:hypothetical protein